jgi:nanoRNase/pAp phosphatase (c-di-AMP/oligoRNAs hydrolase)
MHNPADGGSNGAIWLSNPSGCIVPTRTSASYRIGFCGRKKGEGMKGKHRFHQLTNRLHGLADALAGAEQVLIVPHNNPDPDAIASALALQTLVTEHLLYPATVAYQGAIGRAENRALIRYLDFPLKRLTPAELKAASHLVLVDTQPDAGNAPLPVGVVPDVVIDHHPLRTAYRQATYADIRPQVGATASLLVEYLRAANLPISPALATALFYGIKTDTQGLERGASECDRAAFGYLGPQVDLAAIFKIEHAPMPSDYFSTLTYALQSARCYDQVMVSYLGAMSYPDLAANIADFFMRRQGLRWVFCAGIHKEHLYLSVRTSYQQGAGRLIQSVVGARGSAGGHGSMAGAQIPLNGERPDALIDELCRHFLAHLNVPADQLGEPLVQM